jgi:hypothetical protein
VVVSERATVCAVAYDPGAGLKVGTTAASVYVAETSKLFRCPLLVAIALSTVPVAFIETVAVPPGAVVWVVPLAGIVGIDPSVV